MLNRLKFPFLLLIVFLLALLTWFYQANLPVKMVEAPSVNGVAHLQCVSYSPFYHPGENPAYPNMHIAPAQIDADLKALSKVTDCVRTYAVAQGLDYVPAAAQKLDMKVLLGAWVSWTDKDNRAQVELAVSLANQYKDTVKGVIVGNEVLLRGEQPEATVHGYLQWAQQHTDVPVTYADVWEFWLKHPSLEQDVDFITVHILPYWEDSPVPIERAVWHTADVMGHLKSVFKRPLLIGETGWPSQGRQRFGAKPSLINEARYMREFLSTAKLEGWQYNVIEAIDQPWKRDLEGTVGGYWGVLDTDLQPKFALTGKVSERHDGHLPWVLALGAAFLVFALSKKGMRFGVFQSTYSAVFASVFVLLAYLQIEYVAMAARSWIELIALSGVVLLGWVISVRHGWQAVLLGRKHLTVDAGLHVLLLVAIGLSSWWLYVDGRYRNFPSALVLMPIVMMAISLVHAYATHMASSGLKYLDAFFAKPLAMRVGLFDFLGLLAIVFSSFVLMLEPQNQAAQIWLALSILATLLAMCEI